MFSIVVPRGQATAERRGSAPRVDIDQALHGLNVLCVDNDRDILAGMQALLSRWGVHTVLATTVDEALGKIVELPDVLLVDYHLHDRLDGLDTLDALREAAGQPIPGALLTADGSDALKQSARERGYRVLTKPVKPA